MKAATAALAAEKHGKFWEYHDLLFKNYNRLNDQAIENFALTLNINKEEFDQNTKDPSIKQRIQQDVSDARQAGVRGTPTVFINGKRLMDRTLKGFQTVIDKELQKFEQKGSKTGS